MNSIPEGKAGERTAWIRSRRGDRNAVDPDRAVGFFREEEATPDGRVVSASTILIANRECPFTCLMCDLWKDTLEVSLVPGQVVRQVREVLSRLGDSPIVKLYNAGSFFDPRAIPPEDLPEIAALVRSCERVVVEAHPAFVNRECLRFAERLEGRLEVAIGLETIHPEVLPRLNKNMTLRDFERAARFLVDHDVDVRAFLLLRPPYLSEQEGLEWTCRSLDFARDAGVGCSVVIPTRDGNGAMEHLRELGDFHPPALRSLEAALAYGIPRGRTLADLWDFERVAACGKCRPERRNRLHQMNLRQVVLPAIECECPESH